MTDQEAFDKLKQGDRTAMEWVYRYKRDSFVHFFMKEKRISVEEATDLAIDALLALAAWAERDINRSLTAQLLTLWISIGKNLYHNEKKSKTKMPIVNWTDFLVLTKNTEGGENPFETNDFEEILPTVEDLVNQMPDPCLSILKQYYWGKHTDKMVSEYLNANKINIKDMNESAVKMKRTRCIDSLRKLIFNRLK